MFLKPANKKDKNTGKNWGVKSVLLFIKHSPQFPLKPLIPLMRFFDFMKNNHIFHTPGKNYLYYKLCESYRIGNKTRHRTIITLDKLEERKLLANC